MAGIASGSAADAAGRKTLPTTPTCGKFSSRKVSDVLAVGSRLYLDHTLVHGTSCTYEGLTAKQSAVLAGKQVPYNQITYYPSLLIDIQTTTKTLFDLQKGLILKGASTVGTTSPKDPWRIGSEELFTSGEVTGDKMPPCNSMILYDNWLGPPACMGQPALRKLAVLAWIPLGGATGRMVFLSAAAQAGRPLNLSHLLELAKESVTGQLY